MLVVEVVGGFGRTSIAAELRSLAASSSAPVDVVTASSPSHIAAVVLAASATSAETPLEDEGYADVVLSADSAEVVAVWKSRLEPFARHLTGEPTPSSPAELVDSDPGWASVARRKLNRVRKALSVLDGSDAFGYEHIGSTSVPGLMAKPIIDLQVRLPQLPPAETVSPLLVRTGYLPATGSRPDSPGVFEDAQRGRQLVDQGLLRKQLYFCPDPAAPSILHIRHRDSPFARHTVLLRNWLRENPADRAAYQRLKLELAEKHAGDPDYDDYTRGKSTFIAELANRIDDNRGWASAGR